MKSFEVYRHNTGSYLNKIKYTTLNSLMLMETNIIRIEGKPVLVRGMNTKEMLGLTLKLKYSDFNIFDFLENYYEYYHKIKIDPAKYLSDSGKEYRTLFDRLNEFKQSFIEDFLTRRNVFLSGKKTWCITNIHWMIRSEVLYCYVNIRSSDFKRVLYTDIYVILQLCQSIRKKFRTKGIDLTININSAHIYV